jgi:hypothetical protein
MPEKSPNQDQDPANQGGPSDDPMDDVHQARQDYLSATDRFVAGISDAPDDMLMAGLEGLERQMAEARKRAGLPAVDAENVSDEAAMQGELLEWRIGNYLDTDHPLTAGEQLEITGAFWGQLGYRMPELSEAQVSKLQAALEANPGTRVMPAPMNVDFRQNLTHRHRMAESAVGYRSIKGGGAGLFDPVMRTDAMADNEIYGPSPTESLRYVTAAGNLVSREEYIRTLQETGEAVDGDRPDLVWTFALLDPNPEAKPSTTTIQAVYPEINPALTPDTVIGLNILHAVSGHIPKQHARQLANEFLVDAQNPSTSLSQQEQVQAYFVSVWPGSRLEMDTGFLCDVTEYYADEEDKLEPEDNWLPVPGNDDEYTIMGDYLVRKAVVVAL